jgi:hypothetical protein
VLAKVAAAGITLTRLPDGRIWAQPSSRLTDDLRALIRAYKPELLASLADPAPEARRRRVLAMLEVNPGARYALITDDRADPAAVIVALAIRGQATCELRIPRDRYDGTLLLDLIERHGGAVH